ncbi:MAG TPA: hypothetical protein VGM43_22950 [Bryobacteraceae bacterium]|jgi:hypothetical protein
MTAFQQANVDIATDANFGETVTYSRNASQSGPAISLSLQVAVKTGGEYASPTGPLEGSVFIPQASAITGGPQKGDLLVIPSLGSRTFVVYLIYLDPSIGWAELKIRLASK